MSNLYTSFDKSEKVWSGPKKTLLFNPKVSVGQVLFTCLSRQHPDNILQINDGEGTKLTSKEVLSMSTKVAYNLQKMKLKQTDVIGIMSHNTTNMTPLCYGMFFIGVPFHAIDSDLTKDTAVRLWNVTKPKVIFCDGSSLDLVKTVTKELKLNCEIFTLNEHQKGLKQFEDLLGDLPNGVSFIPSEIMSSDQTASISNSSGSTGLPKAVTMSHKIIMETLSTL